MNRLTNDPLLKIAVHRIISSNLEDRHKTDAILDIMQRQIEIAVQLAITNPELSHLKTPLGKSPE